MESMRTPSNPKGGQEDLSEGGNDIQRSGSHGGLITFAGLSKPPRP